MLLHQVQNRTRIPERIIDRVETGRGLDYSVVRKLITFYDKNMRIVFEDNSLSSDRKLT